MLAPAATLATWTLIDLLRGGRVTAIGAATAIVVGLVVVTPAAGYIGPASALAIGALGAFPSYFALLYRAKTKLDDSLDVVAAHGLGGATGAMLTGVFAEAAWSGGANGLIGGNPGQVLIQILSVLIVLAYSGAATFVILKVLALVMPLGSAGASKAWGSTSPSTARKPTPAATARSSSSPASRVCARGDRRGRRLNLDQFFSLNSPISL